MLTAITESGKIFSLGEQYKKIYLHDLKKKEQFYCPQCHEKVILKIGTKRIHHFAHQKGSDCSESFERESEYHMAGKLNLYKWLKGLGLSPKLEPYFSDIKQRPDISFIYEGKTYCLEFQCATISEEVFVKRTVGYTQNFLYPIWILGGKNINRKNNAKVSLSSFQSLFLARNSKSQWYIPSYCPHINQFIFLSNITPISNRNAVAHFLIQRLENTSISDFLDPCVNRSISVSEWRNGMAYLKKSILFRKDIHQAPFLQELYSHSIHPQFLPPFVGIPLPANPIIEESPFIWQAYIFLDHLLGQNSGKVITFSEVLVSILNRKRRSNLKLRRLPNIKESLLAAAVTDYLNVLVKVDVLTKVDDKTFIVSKPIKIANRLDEWMEDEESFYKQYGHFLFLPS